MNPTATVPNFTEFKIAESPTTLEINIGHRSTARAIAHSQKHEIADWCRKMKKQEAWLIHSTGKFRVLASTGLPESEQRKLALSGGRPELLNASQLDILEFLAEQDRLGKIVILTWHIHSLPRNRNRCFYTSDRLTVERASWTPGQFHDYDYLQAWRNADPSLKKFDDLCKELDQHNFVSGLDYKLVRPDGVLCEYQTDYYKLINRHGEQIRAGVSDPDAYSILGEVKI